MVSVQFYNKGKIGEGTIGFAIASGGVAYDTMEFNPASATYRGTMTVGGSEVTSLEEVKTNIKEANFKSLNLFHKNKSKIYGGYLKWLLKTLPLLLKLLKSLHFSSLRSSYLKSKPSLVYPVLSW